MKGPPYDITLLVVTHCHDDHVGCLPELVSNEIISPRYALLTHPQMGFGRSSEDSDESDDRADARTQVLAAALREEDARDLGDDELEEFLKEVGKVERRYLQMHKELNDRKVKVIEYIGKTKLPSELEALLKPSGMKILGPSQDQLLLCAEQISTTNKLARDMVRDALSSDSDLSDVELYRQIASAFDETRNPRGNGMNCQSITLAFGPPNARALIAGDMQFTEPGVEGADDEVAALRQAVAEAGPYKLFKTTHHSAHNGQDKQFLEELGNPPLLIHSGGFKDSGHPNPGVLRMMKSRARLHKTAFARTDRNGHIQVEPHLGEDDAIAISRGRLNDFTDNVKDIEPPVPKSVSPAPVAASEPQGAARAEGQQSTEGAAGYLGQPQVVIVNLPQGPVDITVAGVHIVVPGALPLVTDKRQVRVQGGGVVVRNKPESISLAAGRELPDLLFAVNADGLADSIGREEANQVLKAISSAGKRIVEVGETIEESVEITRRAIRAGKRPAGLVLIGGYDVIGSEIVEVINTGSLEESIVETDGDLFFVWSDEDYGDFNDDMLSEIPISRIPDAHDFELLRNALQAKAVRPTLSEDKKHIPGFGIRNVHRPFADNVWSGSNLGAPLHSCEAFMADQIQVGHTEPQLHYLMLHGMAEDGKAFSGEYLTGGYPIAYRVGNVPKRFEGVVFTGCCWGALIVDNIARNAISQATSHRKVSDSIALSYLKAGANAFVGCTGSHYSGPDEDIDENYAARLHMAFWEGICSDGLQPSAALFRARENYGAWVAKRGDLDGKLALARRLKNRAQFTCLGLGW